MRMLTSSIRADIDVVAFDLDGTLVDSPLDFVAIRQELGWQDASDLLQSMAMLPDEISRQHAAGVIYRHEMQAAEQSVLLPGVLECLSQFQAQGIPTAILTRNMRAATQLMIQKLQIPISLVLTREDCAAKPDPEGLYRIAAHYHTKVQRLLYVGDYHFDLTTAANAGAQSCLLLNANNHQFSSQADWVIAEYQQLARALTS
ncbi:HAD family hydrolase [Alkalimonas amylolytica]|uniref:Haloacid dehalogenase superfamily, subfamily IA, variant 3 with third motif having DD or ED/haloacid dehalogenase superfamily, subfamily IA, variant 1 with third motif having Dx(3-4)D or Dx(3-4)E n=1 Tax=Alkalimonas amylolytica TaxID=152573 RepID=A0A1H4BDD1_ALKAM|nr:HAD family hydrolase [Alkalimonas amylolytica]SEA45998.1 haloacid dehalogenase superfamily, subfamily IA, variant 3 with third motif having DD or ED/haloacid dehalogenase superfamily, subfamily IA, variant 1 with third motif having Dx(3-4)D or Dx(3-4)E [Alkalimonas amylolytica]